MEGKLRNERRERGKERSWKLQTRMKGKTKPRNEGRRRNSEGNRYGDETPNELITEAKTPKEQDGNGGETPGKGKEINSKTNGARIGERTEAKLRKRAKRRRNSEGTRRRTKTPNGKWRRNSKERKGVETPKSKEEEERRRTPKQEGCGVQAELGGG